MTIVVTGATGFLGSQVVTALRARGLNPVAALRDDPRRPIHEDVPALRLDLARPGSALEALKAIGADAVIHCAAYGVDYRDQDLESALRINVDGTLQLFDAAHRLGIGRFLHIGTSYEYGDHPGLISEETPLAPDGLYGGTKAAASILLLALRHAVPPRLVVLRPFGMYGPGEGPHKLVPQVIGAARSGAPLDLTEGIEVRDYLPVTDVARGIAELTALPDEEFPAGRVFNICSGEGRSIRQFASDVAEAAGADRSVLRFGRLPIRPEAPARVVGDPTRWQTLWADLGRPDVTQQTGLGETVTRMQEEM